MRLRWLAPVAAPLTLADIGRGLAGVVRPRGTLDAATEELRRALGVEHAWLVSSGRAALTLVLRALAELSGRSRVIIPAYTCYSVPAAIVRAGLDIVPCDIDAATLDFAYEELEARLSEAPALCVVSTHLFGVPADVERARRLAEGYGAVIVEDAAQAFGFKRGEQWLGTLGDAGFFSFGRGKTLSAGAGGAIVCNRNDLAALIDREYCKLSPPAALRTLVLLAEAAVTSILVRPWLYGIPARLRFLGLGETTYSTDFPIARLSGGQAGLLLSWPNRIGKMNGARARTVKGLRSGANNPRVDAPLCLRLPVLCASREQRDRLCSKNRGGRLGLSAMYPTAITGIEELKDRIGERPCPVAQAVSERLLTVPVHPLVSDSDIAAITHLLSDVHDGLVSGEHLEPA